MCKSVQMGEMRTSRSLARARHRAVRAVSSLPPGTDLLTTTVLDTLAPKYAAQTKALRAELPKAGIDANGPTIAMNVGDFEGVQPDHHGLQLQYRQESSRQGRSGFCHLAHDGQARQFR